MAEIPTEGYAKINHVVNSALAFSLAEGRERTGARHTHAMGPCGKECRPPEDQNRCTVRVTSSSGRSSSPNTTRPSPDAESKSPPQGGHGRTRDDQEKQALPRLAQVAQPLAYRAVDPARPRSTWLPNGVLQLPVIHSLGLRSWCDVKGTQKRSAQYFP